MCHVPTVDRICGLRSWLYRWPALPFSAVACEEKGPVNETVRCQTSGRPRVTGKESPTADTTDGMDYDPWERFNEKTFWFNHDVLDRYALKPVATVWAKIPDSMRQGLANAFYNLAMPKRLRYGKAKGWLTADMLARTCLPLVILEAQEEIVAMRTLRTAYQNLYPEATDEALIWRVRQGLQNGEWKIFFELLKLSRPGTV